MRFSSYVYWQRSREMRPHFSRPSLYHTGRRRIGGAATREEAVPADSQFLQAQGLPTSFAIRHRGPGHIIPQMLRENWRYREAGGGRSGRQPISPGPGTSRIVCAYDIKALGRLYHKGIVRDHRLVVQRLPPEEKHLMQCKKSVFHCQRHRGPSEGMAPGPGPPHIVCHQA